MSGLVFLHLTEGRCLPHKDSWGQDQEAGENARAQVCPHLDLPPLPGRFPKGRREAKKCQKLDLRLFSLDLCLQTTGRKKAQEKNWVKEVSWSSLTRHKVHCHHEIESLFGTKELKVKSYLLHSLICLVRYRSFPHSTGTEWFRNLLTTYFSIR